ncbi:unnamed protein product [Moneuplotes crassus]|uniref:Uncharacterized protein n=1 Tax=Euplotes crassus TaxID=5936 RepID=A0AAD1U2L1_EUPCR|nr:unnamed protein product [Moneuplotes crassus]
MKGCDTLSEHHNPSRANFQYCLHISIKQILCFIRPSKPGEELYKFKFSRVFISFKNIRTSCKLNRNRYTINDWHALLTGSTKGEFLDFNGCDNQASNDPDGATSTSIGFQIDGLVNEYETTVISFLEILGQAGGIFEILFLMFSIVLRVFTKFLLQKEIKKVQNKEKLKEEWFTYPTQNPLEFRKNKRRNKIKSIALESMGKYRMCNRNTNSQKYNPVEDRSQCN